MINTSYLVVVLLASTFLISYISADPHPWEPYSEMEQGFSFQQARMFHDTFFTAWDVAAPMITKLVKDKYDDYREKYHGSDTVAGHAGRSHHSSEESGETTTNISSNKTTPITPTDKPNVTKVDKKHKSKTKGRRRKSKNKKRTQDQDESGIGRSFILANVKVKPVKEVKFIFERTTPSFISTTLGTEGEVSQPTIRSAIMPPPKEGEER